MVRDLFANVFQNIHIEMELFTEYICYLYDDLFVEIGKMEWNTFPNKIFCLTSLLYYSSREESNDRHLSSPYGRRSYHLTPNDSQDAGAEQRCLRWMHNPSVYANEICTVEKQTLSSSTVQWEMREWLGKAQWKLLLKLLIFSRQGHTKDYYCLVWINLYTWAFCGLWSAVFRSV